MSLLSFSIRSISMVIFSFLLYDYECLGERICEVLFFWRDLFCGGALGMLDYVFLLEVANSLIFFKG
jgi:hypothetical protein